MNYRNIDLHVLDPPFVSTPFVSDDTYCCPLDEKRKEKNHKKSSTAVTAANHTIVLTVHWPFVSVSPQGH